MDERNFPPPGTGVTFVGEVDAKSFPRGIVVSTLEGPTVNVTEDGNPGKGAAVSLDLFYREWRCDTNGAALPAYAFAAAMLIDHAPGEGWKMIDVECDMRDFPRPGVVASIHRRPVGKPPEYRLAWLEVAGFFTADYDGERYAIID